MTNEEKFKTLVDLKLSKIGERITKDAAEDLQQNYAKRDFHAGELEQLADNYVMHSITQELYLQSSKNLLK